MKKDAPRNSSQTKQPSARHQYQHQVPTVIHDPEQDMMVLARWTHRAMKDPTKFWGTIAGVVVGLLAIVILSNFVGTGSSANSEIWKKLDAVKSAADRAEVAEEFSGNSAAVWARLQAANQYYNQGFSEFPNNRDVALPNLQKAIANYEEVLRIAPKDSLPARAAALGRARALEARNELPKAIEQYESIVKNWPGTKEAGEAQKFAEELKRPEAAAFYKELFAYSPTKVTLPPEGTQNLNFPLLPSPGSSFPNSFPAESNSGGLIPSIPLLPPPPPSPVTKGGEPALKPGTPSSKSANPTAPVPSTAGLPDDPFGAGGSTPKPQPAPPASKGGSPKS